MRFYPLGITAEPKSISYQSLYIQAQTNSAKIRQVLEFQEHRPILLHFDTHEDTLIWFWSVLFANGIPVIIAPFNDTESRQDYMDGLSALFEQPFCITTDHLRHVFNAADKFSVRTAEWLQSLSSLSGTQLDLHCYDAGSTTAILMLTSGSTGVPKAVQLSHMQILAAVAGKASVRSLPRNSPFFNWIGLDHVASLIEIHVQSLWLGVDQIHAHAADVVSSPTMFLTFLHRHQVSRTFAPNFFLAQLVSAMHQEKSYPKWDLSHLVIVASGGEDNDVETCVAASTLFESLGAPPNVITTGFGMTETCAGAIFNLECPDYDLRHARTIASLGTCMPGIEMRVTLPEGNSTPTPPGIPGNLEVRGKVVFHGYYRNSEATAESFTPDGWFRTGDLAMIDAQGYLNLIGRVKDVVNINGVKFQLHIIQSAVEQAIANRVARVVTFASRTAHTEQVTVAYIPRHFQINSQDIIDLEKDILRTCQLQVGASPLIFCIREESLPVLPTSALGKISRAKMRNLFETGAFFKDMELHSKRVQQIKLKKREMACRNNMSDTEALLIRLLAEIRGIHSNDIEVDTSIFELGFSSIDVIRLKNRLDTQLGVNLPMTLLMRHPSPSAMSQALDTAHINRTKAERVSTTYDPVVVLSKSGSKTPLWLVHPGIGEVLVFVGLAQHLAGDDRPVYALRARGFEPGHARFESIEEAVETYMTSIRQRQPRGPYAIAGYSYGTMLAFEIVKRLESADGQGTVRFLGSFNLPPNIKTRMRQLHWNACLLHLVHFLGLIAEEDAEQIESGDLRDTDHDEALTKVLDNSNLDRLRELGLDRSALMHWYVPSPAVMFLYQDV